MDSNTRLGVPVGAEDADRYFEDWARLSDEAGVAFQALMEDREPPPEPTLEFVRDVWIDALGVMSHHADALGSLEVTGSLAAYHDAYVSAYQELITTIREEMAGYTSLENFAGYQFESFFDSPKLTLDHLDVLYPMGAACYNLEMLLPPEEGDSLGCPPIAAVLVEGGQAWTAVPQVAPVGGWLELEITNTDGDVINLVIIAILSGDPLDLPVVGGVVDLSDGEDRSGSSRFELIHPPEVLSPGEGLAIRTDRSYPIVIFDNSPGRFESGAVVVVTRTATP